jgi:N-dimethylarginine dimethylaminohydrolase
MISINSNNEWDTLKEVILGTADHMNWSTTKDFRSKFKSAPVGKVPNTIIYQTNNALESFKKLLERHGVNVLRPEPINYQERNGFGCYSPRDSILIIGDKAICSPMHLKDRLMEQEALTPHLIGRSLIMYPEQDSEYMFDAANVMRCNNEILFLISSTGNYGGARWLQNVLGNEYRITTIPKTVYHGSHLDSTIVPLREGLVMLNAERVTEDTIPSFMESWDKLWISKDDIKDTPTITQPICTKWIALNVLSINPELVVCDPDQFILREKLNRVGIESIGVKLPHARYLLGGHHCTTLDTIRE